jgi:glutamate synthase (NADPH/NADH)
LKRFGKDATRSWCRRRRPDAVSQFDFFYLFSFFPLFFFLSFSLLVDCGVPFCQDNHSYGCPIGNKIPEWNELVHRGEWKEAFLSLKTTNNFPEWTSKVCPAPCEGACVLGIIKEPVAIKSIELAIIEKAYEEGWMKANPPAHRTGKRVAIVGSGPAGLSAADQLNQMGHWVTVYERADRCGGLMQYGVPHPKINKEKLVQGRIEILEEEGITFVTNSTVGEDKAFEALKKEFDAVLLATGSTIPRTLEVPGSDLPQIHPAMEFLHASQKALEDTGNLSKTWRKDLAKVDGWIDVKGLNVIIIGSGDTGTDCLATSVRMGAKSVTLFDIVPQPPKERLAGNPWPEQPLVYRVEYGHAEARAVYGQDPREFAVTISDFISDEEGKLSGVRTHNFVNGTIIPDSKNVVAADVVFLAMGFTGPEIIPETESLIAKRGLYSAPKFQTKADNVFAAGDCRRGQSLVVWAISEGRKAAEEINNYFLK